MMSDPATSLGALQLPAELILALLEAADQTVRRTVGKIQAAPAKARPDAAGGYRYAAVERIGAAGGAVAPEAGEQGASGPDSRSAAAAVAGLPEGKVSVP